MPTQQDPSPDTIETPVRVYLTPDTGGRTTNVGTTLIALEPLR